MYGVVWSNPAELAIATPPGITSKDSPTVQRGTRGHGYRDELGCVQNHPGVDSRSEPADLEKAVDPKGQETAQLEPASPLDNRGFAEFVKDIVTSLHSSRITYAVTGALAASYYGVPRTTVDIDFKVRVPRPKLRLLWNACERAGLVVDRTRALKKLRSGYNIVSFEDSLSAHTADFIIETKQKIERRKGTLLGLRVFYESPETLVLAKLRMIRATLPRERAEKDREDVRAILAQTRVNMRKIVAGSKRQGTEIVFQELLRKTASHRIPTRN